mmetsp:Transcript_47781/g.144496  ORF Transcript_47781/g.144496 Transcript_47781/m.144496 type:complete len:365 (+) Transcript_47781:222-1316(+)|eukprot:CAMPEP_0113541816 /NCGR_PEP_ID=MMETSP0015_2-20120614/9254_1 /TAXON_ID=2838 /ORGANISM="Odontella" /LENGTH=364 /DNA_ID=CAMNT_0000441789 /DNA_START=141 /DNA_END=1235 /DNA_ORIENTATION=+ /assembly_acc=CAM_ASM_000160
MKITSVAILASVQVACAFAFTYRPSSNHGHFAHRSECRKDWRLASSEEDVFELAADDAAFPSDSAEKLEINGDIATLKVNGDASAGSDEAKRASLTNGLLRVAASSDRGQFDTSLQKDKIASIVSNLEALNPTTCPAESSAMEGTWELLYSSTQLFRSSPFFMAGRAVCETEEQAKQYDWFCDMHRAALAISTIGKVRQIISSDRMTSEFEVKVGAVPFLSDFTPLKYSGGLPFTVEGAIVSSADITPTDSGEGWEIFMDTVEIKGSNIPLLRQALDAGIKLGSRDLGSFLEENLSGYSNPRPVFKTTYLDEHIRISKDQDGKLFVYGKVSDDTHPSDYDGVDSDLGLLKLLEGFNDSITKFYI